MHCFSAGLTIRQTRQIPWGQPKIQAIFRIIIIINAKIKVTLNKKMLQGHFTKNYHNTLSVSKGGLEQSCLQIPAKRNEYAVLAFTRFTF